MTVTTARIDILGVGVHPQTLDGAVDTLGGWIARREPHYVCITGVHGVVASQDDHDLLRIHNEAGMVTTDGMPLVWLSRRRTANGTVVERVYGPELMLHTFARSETDGWRHFLYGASPDTLARLRANLEERFPGAEIVGAFSPPFRALDPGEDEAIEARIIQARPDIVWVGLSTPRQEEWMAAHVGRVHAPVLVGVGAAFDFHAGVRRQAPRWVQRAGLEWAFRLASEPRRLAGRYLRNNPRFMWMITREALRDRWGGRSVGAPTTQAVPDCPDAAAATHERPSASRRLAGAVAGTPIARAAAFPERFAMVARHDARVVGASARWLATSREHTNLTYDLTPLSREHLAWFVSEVCAVPVAEVRAYLAEIETDDELRDHIGRATARADRRGLADRAVRYGRRVGWYAIARATRPAHVVETGVDKGLGTCVFAAALLRNAGEGHPGRVTSLDINPAAGYLARAEPWSDVIELKVGDSVRSIGDLETPVDLFLHDSDHRAGHEEREFEAIEGHLASGALLLTDNVTETSVLAEHAERTGRRFLAFRETPARHWYPGDGIGAAWHGRHDVCDHVT